MLQSSSELAATVPAMPLIPGQCILCLRVLALMLAEQLRTHIIEVVGTWTCLLHLTCFVCPGWVTWSM